MLRRDMTGRWSEADIPDLSGKTFVVTGANSGLGLETARALAQHHAAVVLACRSLERGSAAVERIRAVAPDADLYVEALDVSSLSSVRGFAERFVKNRGRLDGLVNNAGIMAIPRRESVDGFELQMATNHLGHFALTDALLPCLVRTGGARVVTVSSMMHTRGDLRALDERELNSLDGYDTWGAYSRTKLANVLFAYELDRRLKARGLNVISVACHPGYAATHLQSVGPEMTGSLFAKAVMAIGNALFAQSARAGALPTLYAAVDPGVRGGEFIGPDGLQQLWGAPVKQRSSRASRDAEAARKLWETSSRMTGATYASLS
jgi:NAD(P)-dependent dehydrogenase (short-subunit alcohol dehydrogenase family)